MATELTSYADVISKLSERTAVTFEGATWDEYVSALEAMSDRPGIRLTFDQGVLQAMTLSPEHEALTRFLDQLIGQLRIRLRLNIRYFGSTAFKKRSLQKGTEPDCCFYVQSAHLLGNRIDFDVETAPPPDIVVEIDVHHDTIFKLPIYAALGVGEVWHFDGKQLQIFALCGDWYELADRSLALPMLTPEILTEYLTRFPAGGELETLLAFDDWLKTHSN